MNQPQQNTHIALPIELGEAMFALLAKLPFEQVANVCLAYRNQGIPFTPTPPATETKPTDSADVDQTKPESA